MRLVSFIFCCSISSLTAVSTAAQSIGAVRVDSKTMRLDGRLTEDVWKSAPAAGHFTQREPTEGQPALDSTVVRFAYDDDALWIGARMYSRNPRAIRALVTRRDREGTSEQLIVSLDTHRDRRTAYTFAVTPAGVRIDYFHSSDFESSRNYDYDPVWQTETAIDSLGWTAEMRIPFTQLRFNGGDIQEWGVNVVRRVPATNEDSYWVLVKRNETGWSSRMAVLTGIRGVRPGRRIELLPYVAGDSRFTRVTDPANPFAKKNESGMRAGGDLKMGVGPNLTLDVTINPDFGQVEADPAEVNLTAFETFFDERRPFFLEGSQLFGGRGFYYSRRIGAAPRGSSDADYEDRIDNTTILGAAKLTGRMPSGLSIAALAALTDEEAIRTYDLASDTFGKAVVAPRTEYAVASVQQEFGKTRSTIGGTVTMVQRNLGDNSPLANLLASAAYSAIVDGRLRWAGGMYDASAYLGVTNVRGDSIAILRQQLSSRRYWQRPDASHVAVDPSRRALSGTSMGINHSKLSGKHWLWNVDVSLESPGLEPNDIGASGNVDNIGAVGQIRYRETVPRGWYRSYEFLMGSDATWNFEKTRTASEAYGNTDVTLANFWRLSFNGQYVPRATSDVLTRGGPLMGTPRGGRGEIELRNRAGSRNGWGAELSAATDEFGGWSRDIEAGLEYRPGAQLELAIEPRWSRGESSQQFVATQSGGRAETFGTRYVFAHVDRSEVAASVRLNYTFTPELTLETYVEPFASSGIYHGFGELKKPGGSDLIVYGQNGTTLTRQPDGSYTVAADGQTFALSNPDFNIRSLRSNAVVRWEWRPGSTLYLVWQQDRNANRAIRNVRPGNLLDGFSAPGENFLALKVSYWLALK